MMLERWIGKVAVVTGASVGIGADIATSLADLGIIVVGLARRVELIKSLTTTGTIHAIKCDLTNEEDILDAFRWIENNLGGVDILINNAGVLKMSSLIDGETKDWKHMMKLNVLSLSICSREAIKSMKTKAEGHIININSIAGHHVPQAAELLAGPYSGSKFAVTSLTESLKMELRKNNFKIKITSISPGPVQTDMLKELSSSSTMSKVDASDLGEFVLETKDVSDAVIFALGTRPTVNIDEMKILPFRTLTTEPKVMY